MKLFVGEQLGIDCGIDEVGRGPWAGPVVAAAVVLSNDSMVKLLDDSKKLSKKKRDFLFDEIKNNSEIGIGFSSVQEIDKHNILQATFIAMKRAVGALTILPKRALIDGNCEPPDFPCPTETIVKGDTKVASIAAASIVAKVTRDAYMKDLAKKYPGYGWERNFGYGVKAHKDALKILGVTPEHRCSFKPIHNMLC